MPTKGQKEKNSRRRRARKKWTVGAKVGWRSGNQVLPATVVEDKGPIRGSEEHLVMVRVPSSASTSTTFTTTSGRLVLSHSVAALNIKIVGAEER